MRDIIKKLPKLRGHGKNRAKSVFDRGPEAVVNLSTLHVFKANDVVTPTALVAKGLIKEVVGKLPKVKILGTGDITIALKFEGCDVSETAKEKIKKAGGTITQTEKPKTQSPELLAKIAAKKEAKLNKGAKGGAKKGKK